MAKVLYRVGEGANLEALPRGTKVGDEIRLTEAEALYERDMGRLIDVEAEKAGADETAALAAAAEVAARTAAEEAAMAPRIELQPGEADGIEKTAMEGDTLTVSEDEAGTPKTRRR